MLPNLTELSSGHGFTAGDLDTSGYVAVIPAYQKIYFADGRTQDNGGYNKLDFINTRLVGTASGSFKRGEIVTQATSNAAGIFDETVTVGEETWHLVYRTTTTEFDATHQVTGADSGITLTPSSVVAPPHWLPWVETSGYEGLPEGGANAGCLHNGSIVLNSIYNPNQWYASRQSNPLDWLVSQDDLGTPTSSQTSKAGVVADPLVVPISFRDGYLIFGCENQMWLLRGQFTSGIQTNISYSTGIFSPTSYCWDNKNNLYFIGLNGLYLLTPDAIINSAPPINLTEERLPNLFKQLKLNRQTDRIAMEYDKNRNGILVSISQLDYNWGFSFWINLRKNDKDQITAGIFPESYATNNYIPTAMHFLDSRKSEYRNLLIGCADGTLRKYDESIKSDDGPEGDVINSYVTFGPISSVEKLRQQIELNEASLKLGENTDGVTLEIFKAETAEKVINKIVGNKDADAIKTFSLDGLQTSLRQRVTGAAIALLLKNTTYDETWIMENLLIDLKDGGKK